MKAFRVSFAAVFSFCVSWIPAGVLIILEYGFAVSIPSTARSIPFLFASTSAWINPVIYGVMNRAMHREYRNIIFCRKELTLQIRLGVCSDYIFLLCKFSVQ